jgi:hypothetical protein
MVDAIASWQTFALALLVFGFAPGALLRLIVLAFRADDPRRRELLAELHAVPRIERPFWVLEQLEVALCEGLWERATSAASGRRRVIHEACTFHLVYGIIDAADIITPRHRIQYARPHVSHGATPVPGLPVAVSRLLTFWEIPLLRTDLRGWNPTVAHRQLEQDLAAEKRLINRIRLVAPLLSQAARLRLLNGQERAKALIIGGLRRTLLALGLLPLLPVVCLICLIILITCLGELIDRTFAGK